MRLIALVVTYWEKHLLMHVSVTLPRNSGENLLADSLRANMLRGSFLATPLARRVQGLI